MSETITVTVRREDALILVLGPLEASIKKSAGEISPDASVRRLRETVARALRDIPPGEAHNPKDES